jgi:hypothetical protein
MHTFTYGFEVWRTVTTTTTTTKKEQEIWQSLRRQAAVVQLVEFARGLRPRSLFVFLFDEYENSTFYNSESEGNVDILLICLHILRV